MITEENTVQKDFDLPDHANELSKAEDTIEKLKTRFNEIKEKKTIDDSSHDKMFEAVMRVLDYVGRLSMPVFAIEDELEEQYIKQYPSAPELAKTLWLQHYDGLHHPYTLLKNRCWRLIDDIDNLYIEMYDKHPPNWKP